MDPASDFDQRLELFFGETSDARARVYARLRDCDSAGGLQLSGNLTGPSCLYAETLPARFALVDRGPGASLLAEAVVPEPCFWTPEMPQLYQATVQLRRGTEMLARAERVIGFRVLGAAGGKLLYHGKRWVLRGVRRDEIAPAPLRDWHAGDAVMIVSRPDDPLCAQASRVGVLIVAELDAPDMREIQRLARWPAVAVVVMPGEAKPELDGLAHNLLLAAKLAPQQSLAPPAWAQMALCDVSPGSDQAADIARCPLPMIASSAPNKPFSSIAEARATCDRLQRDLAARVELSGCDFAGYIV